MPAARPRPEDAVSAVSPALPEAGQAAPRQPAGEATQPLSPARLADDLAVPAPSPVHRLQAELAQLTTPPETVAGLAAEVAYPGWFRICFPLASSLLLWAAILWGVSRIA